MRGYHQDQVKTNAATLFACVDRKMLRDKMGLAAANRLLVVLQEIRRDWFDENTPGWVAWDNAIQSFKKHNEVEYADER